MKVMANGLVIPVDYQANHLFLLVGTNPLPNLVAAQLMLKSQGQLYLVHSGKTQPVAERLARYWTDTEEQSQPQFVYIDEADGANIRQKIEQALKSIGDGQIGLNYTGGTKTMAVHACRTMLDYQRAKRRPVTLSYLDARSNSMYIEHGDDPALMTEPLLYAVKPSIAGIVKLHAFELKSSIATKPMLPELAEVLVEVHQDPTAGTTWRTWCNEALRKNTRTKKAEEWDKENLLRQVQLSMPVDPSLRAVADKMANMFGASDGVFLLDEAAQRSGMEKAKHLCEWLDGKWLEHHAFQAIQQIKEERPQSHIHDIGMGIRPKSEPDRPEYDVDIGVMQGYRLFAISCTTDADPGMCKLKLFEAYLRARNMAGDEAFVGLICMADKLESLERQVGRAWDAEGKVRVFGRPHLSSLADALAEWFISAGSQERSGQ
jgi:hypothetical protein